MTEAVLEVIEKINKQFSDFKKENNEAIKELQKKGHNDPLLKQKIGKMNEAIEELSEQKERIDELEAKLNRPAFGKPGAGAGTEEAKAEKAFQHFMRQGKENISADEIKLLSVDSDAQGGYLVRNEISTQIITKVFETSEVRQDASVQSVGAAGLEIPVDEDEVEATWDGERVPASAIKTPAVGIRKIMAHGMTSKPKATQTILEDTGFNPEQWLISKVAQKFSRKENAAFVSGDGVGKPRGFLTYPAGIASQQIEQVNSGAAALPTADGIMNLLYSLKSFYLQNAKFFMQRRTVKEVRLLKDSQGRYLWQPGLEPGEPQNLMGFAIRKYEDMPAPAAGALSIAFGDMRAAYLILDRLGITTLRDPFTDDPFVVFKTRKRVGGDMVTFEALKIQKIAV